MLSGSVKKDRDTFAPFDKLINGRRSIRKYKTAMPPREWVENMIHCATRAPSPSNTQPVRFIRISSPAIREDLCQAITSGRQKFFEAAEECEGPKRLKNWINSYYRFSKFMFDAPLLFAVGTAAPVSGFSRKLFEAGILKQYDEKDLDIALGLALNTFLLKGEDLGLGSCILTAPLVFISNIEEILETKGLVIKCLVTVGFPDEVPRPIERKSVADIYSEV
jgi:nitroreductase